MGNILVLLGCGQMVRLWKLTFSALNSDWKRNQIWMKLQKLCEIDESLSSLAKFESKFRRILEKLYKTFDVFASFFCLHDVSKCWERKFDTRKPHCEIPTKNHNQCPANTLKTHLKGILITSPPSQHSKHPKIFSIENHYWLVYLKSGVQNICLFIWLVSISD